MGESQLQLTANVIGCAIKVHKELGSGFLESVYERALAIEMDGAGIRFECQLPIEVFYGPDSVGHFVTDFVVESQLLLELKAVSHISAVHEAQMLNYLKATGMRIGLILNFGGSKLHIKRMVHQFDG